MRRLWIEDKLDFDGTHYTAHDATVAPKPLRQPHPPLLLGGFGPRMLDFTAQFGDAWIAWHQPVDTLTADATIVGVEVDADQAVVELSLATSNQHGEHVLVGYATAREAS